MWDKQASIDCLLANIWTASQGGTAGALPT